MFLGSIGNDLSSIGKDITHVVSNPLSAFQGIGQNVSDFGSSVGNFVNNPLQSARRNPLTVGVPLLAAGAGFFGAPAISDEVLMSGAAPIDASANTYLSSLVPGVGDSASSFSVAPFSSAPSMPSWASFGMNPSDFSGVSSSSGAGSFLSGLKPWVQGAGGLYALYTAMQQNRMNRQGEQQKQLYDRQIQSLMSNPNSITGLPGYQAGINAIERAGAAEGYTGSGNIRGLLAQYGGQEYQQRLQQLDALQRDVGNFPSSLPAEGAALSMLSSAFGA